MKIKKIQIQDENSLLKDFLWTSDMPINILIGKNGSGKTTLLKYLAWVFIEVRKEFIESKKSHVPFKFSIKYEIKLDKLINLGDNETISHVNVHISNYQSKNNRCSLEVYENIPVSMAPKAEELFPENIIAYYAGWDTSIQSLFLEIENKYKELARENPSSKLKFGYSKIDQLPLVFIQKKHFDILLACLFSFQYNYALDKKFKEVFHLEKENKNSIVLFVDKPDKIFSQKGNHDNFWGASGEVLQFLENIKSRALDKGTYNDDKGYFSFIFNLDNWYDLREFYGSEKRLYFYLHLLNSSGLFGGFQIFFNKNDENITNRHLSEGEQQLLTILGIKEILLENNSLVLLDEPDTFLHPKWQEQFVPNIIDNIFDLSSDEISVIEPNFLISTHSPNLLKSSDSHYVEVHVLDKGSVEEKSPNFYGRSISSINYNLMNVYERPHKIKKRLEELFKAIELEKVEEAYNLYQDLKAILGKDDEDLIQAKVELDFLSETDD